MLYVAILLLGGVCSYLGPWWAIAPVCLVICFFLARKPAHAFWNSSIAGVTLWSGYSIYLHIGAEAELTTRVAGIFTAGLPALTDIPAIIFVLILVICVVVPLSGFSGLAGVKLRQLIRPLRG